jgi:hypothetical protein
LAASETVSNYAEATPRGFSVSAKWRRIAPMHSALTSDITKSNAASHNSIKKRASASFNRGRTPQTTLRQLAPSLPN